jgi:hypothetical protein
MGTSDSYGDVYILYGWMSRSQIRQGISEPPKSWLTVFWYLLFYWICISKNTHMSISPMAISTNTISPFHQCYFSLPSNPFSASLSLLFAVSLRMFYLSSFHINTWQIWCCIIIGHNKLMKLTTLFHLGIVHNKVLTWGLTKTMV